MHSISLILEVVYTEKCGLVKFLKKVVKTTKKGDSKIWLVNADNFATKRYRYTKYCLQ